MTARADDVWFWLSAALLVVLSVFLIYPLFNIAIGLSSRSETETVFHRDTLADRRQLQLYGLALLFVLLPTVLDFLERWLGLTTLNLTQWLVCLVFALALLLVDEIIKGFLRRRRRSAPAQASQSAAAPEPAK